VQERQQRLGKVVENHDVIDLVLCQKCASFLIYQLSYFIHAKKEPRWQLSVPNIFDIVLYTLMLLKDLQGTIFETHCN